MIHLLLLSFLFSFSLWAHQNSPLSEFQAPATLIAQIKFKNYKLGMWKLSPLQLDIAGVNIQNKTVEVIINEAELKQIENLGFEVNITMTKTLMRAPDSEYKTPIEIEEILKAYQRQYPEYTELREIGKSLQGRSIWALKITSPLNTDLEKKPTVLFNGMHHAREVMGPEVSLDIIETLLTQYGKNNQVTRWLDTTEVWVIPMFNVDGNNIVWSKDNMWRKNARGNYGVDINRNYPYAWGTCNGSSGEKYSQTYRGDKPGSEPETQVMMNFVRDIRPVFDISYHSYSELVIYPMGCDGQRTANADVVEKIGKEIAAELNYTPGTAWETLYSVDGGDIDWMHAEYQVIPYVIEVNSSSDGFQPEFSKRKPTVELNRKGWQLLLNRMDGPGIHGVVSFSNTNNEFQVKVQKKVENQYRDYMTYKGNPNGTFNLILNAGNYKVTIIGNNKETETQEFSVGSARLMAHFNL